MLGGDFEPDELTNASTMLAGVVAKEYDNTVVVMGEDLAKIEKCRSTVIVVKLKSYHKEPARMGQFRGYITVQVMFFDSPRSKKPTEVREFEARGGVHWGDSTPFNNALESVARKIRRNL